MKRNISDSGYRFIPVLLLIALFAASFALAIPASYAQDAELPSMWRSLHGELPTTYEQWSATQYPVPTSYRKQSFSTLAAASMGEVIDIFVNSALYPFISSSLAQYIADLRAEGYTVNLFTGTWANPPALRAQLQANWSSGLVGCVLIGDLPIPWYEMTEPVSWGGEFAQFPIDLYYGDLDGVWTDSNGNGMYDAHTGNVTPDIWVGRLTASTLNWGDENTVVNNYLRKNHDYRQGTLYCNDSSLSYVDDDWIPWASTYSANLAIAYPAQTRVFDGDTTNAGDYEGRLTHNYEWISVFAHSNSSYHQFRTTAGYSYTYNSEIRSIDPVALFYNLFACSATRYIEYNYLGGWYIFANTRGLLAVGSTKTGGMLEADDFYRPLSQGATIGDAFLQWQILNNENGRGADSRAWFYGMNLLGDPTLIIHAPHWRPVLTTLVAPSGAGSVSGGGTYYLGDTATVQATPTAGYRFDHWTGDLSGSANPTSIAMNGNKSVTAVFIARYSLTTTASPSGGGIVSGAGTYDAGASATVAATANSGYHFTYWSGDLSGSINPATITMDGNRSITANFSRTPLAPTDLTATAMSSSQINLSWNFSGTASGFRIYRKSGGGIWGSSAIATVGSSVRSFTNTGLTGTTAYTYRVCTYNSYGNSAYSNEASATTMIYIAAPASLMAKAPSAHEVDLTWQDKSSNETGFSIERSAGTAGAWSVIGEMGANVTSYADITVAASTLYNYRVQAIADTAVSAYSGIAKVTTPIAAPSDLSATAVSTTQINLTWKDNSNNETGFKIQRKKGVSGTWSTIKTVGTNITSFNSTGLAASTQYYYRVRAYKSKKYSAYSNEANATTF